jgi:hypothetical protein
MPRKRTVPPLRPAPGAWRAEVMGRQLIFGHFAQSLLSEPSWTDVKPSAADLENKYLASVYLSWYASILGPEISMDILLDHFGVAILKQSLAKKRGPRPTAVQFEDDLRIHVYVGAIMQVTGESVRRACQQLAKMGLRVRKDLTSGRVWVVLDEAETIRKRYMRVDRDDASIVSIDILRLLHTWRRAGEPPFRNWLKALIARDSAGP